MFVRLTSNRLSMADHRTLAPETAPGFYRSSALSVLPVSSEASIGYHRQDDHLYKWLFRLAVSTSNFNSRNEFSC
jgi:hypothetical protein